MQSYCLQIDEAGREKTAHIRDGFPVAMYETHPRRYPIGYTIWHWHWEIQFCWVVQGEIEFYVEENRYHLAQGQGIFINRGTLHMAKAVHSEEDAYICMDIDSGLLEETAVLGDRYVSPVVANKAIPCLLFTDQADQEIIQALSCSFEDWSAGHPGYEMCVMAQLWRIWHRICGRVEGMAQRGNLGMRPSRAKEMIRYLHLHYQQDIMLDDIAHAVHMSREECCRFFKGITGSTIFGYLREYRIKKSLELLDHGQMTIGEVSEAVGFHSVSYFCQCFRNKMRMTPKQYQKRANIAME